MSWQPVVDQSGRWEWTADADRHLLLAAAGLLVELHDRTVHIYRPAAAIERAVDQRAAQPLDGAVHLSTREVDQVPDGDAVWAWLGELAGQAARADAAMAANRGGSRGTLG